MHKRTLALILLFSAVFMITACHRHQWIDASCESPQTCSICGDTKGEALGHDYAEATCTEAKTCQRCGATVGDPLGHKMRPAATCTREGKCERCEYTEPKKEHVFSAISCTEDSVCVSCGLLNQKATGHNWENNECTNCGEKILTYDDLKAGGYAKKEVYTLGIVSDVDHTYWDAFTIWYRTGDTYVANGQQSIYEKNKTDKMNAFSEIVDGDVIVFKTKVNSDGSYGFTSCSEMEIIDHIDIDDVFNTAYANSPALDYNDVMRNPSKYVGRYDDTVSFSGRVFQVVDDNEEFLIETNNGMVYVVWYRNIEEPKFLEGDRVRIIGEVYGTYTYSSLLRDNTVPRVYATYIG